MILSRRLRNSGVKYLISPMHLKKDLVGSGRFDFFSVSATPALVVITKDQDMEIRFATIVVRQSTVIHHL